MPELPEVETIKNIIKPHIIDRKIISVIVNNDSVIAHPSAVKFENRLNGQIISDFSRRGKFLRLHLVSGDMIVLHLRMTGCLTLEEKETPQEKHTHLIFSLDNGKELRYEDVRRFGKFWLTEKEEKDVFSGIDNLGIEPFEVCADYLREKMGTSKKTVKELLLDQSIIAGIGNIYSDEICFSAKILPYKKGNELAEEELSRLAECISERIAFFIRKNKLPFEDYVKSKGKEYRNTPYLQVYGKAKKPCPICGNPLSGKTIGGRSSVYCEKCQK